MLNLSTIFILLFCTSCYSIVPPAIKSNSFTNNQISKMTQNASEKEDIKYYNSLLVEKNIGWLKQVVKKNIKYYDDNDALHNAVYGLLVASLKFNHVKYSNISFLTYATYWVNFYVYDYITSNTLIHTPRYLDKYVRRINLINDELIQKNYNEDFIANNLNVSEARAVNINNVLNTKHIYDIDNIKQTIRYTDDTTITNLLDLEICLGKLTTKESILIILYYGLNTGEGKTIKELGEIYETSKENIRLKLNIAMGKLRILMM